MIWWKGIPMSEATIDEIWHARMEGLYEDIKTAIIDEAADHCDEDEIIVHAALVESLADNYIVNLRDEYTLIEFIASLGPVLERVVAGKLQQLMEDRYGAAVERALALAT
jgi:hypothetical protein